MRGKDKPPCYSACDAGITPARAGKRGALLLLYWRVKDHPRACGEKDTTATSGTAKEGSPPRVRGKDHTDAAFHLVSGITPARAGKR